MTTTYRITPDAHATLQFVADGAQLPQADVVDLLFRYADPKRLLKIVREGKLADALAFAEWYDQQG